MQNVTNSDIENKYPLYFYLILQDTLLLWIGFYYFITGNAMRILCNVWWFSVTETF